MMALEIMGQQADIINKKGAAKAPVNQSEDAAVKRALDQALTRMNEKRDEEEFEEPKQ
jgi:hypothetical protein